MQKVLVLEYDFMVIKLFQNLIVDVFADTKFIFESDLKLGIEIAFKESPDVIIFGEKNSDKILSTCKLLKLDRRTSHIPLVLLIEKGKDELLQKEAFSKGVDGFLDKNIQKWECISMLQTLLEYSQFKHRLSGNNNIEEKNQFQEALKEREKQINEAQSIGKVGSWMFNLDTGKISISNESYKIYGLTQGKEYSIEEVQKVPLPEYRKKLNSKLYDLIKKNKEYDLDFKIKRPLDGQIVDIHSIAKFDKDANTVTGIIQDITEKKRAEEALRLSEEKFRSVFQSAPDAVISTDDTGMVTDWNTGAEQIFGYTEDEMVGREITSILPKNARYQSKDRMYRIISVNKSETGFQTSELEGVHKTGRKFPIELSLAKWKTTQGIFFTAIIRDISQRKQVEDELLRAKEKAEESDRLKSAFLANMSHEIRTPMNGILGFADLLKESNVTEKQKNEYVAIIEESGNRMLNTINDLIDISKIEAGMVNMEYSDVFVHEQMEYLYNFFKLETDKKGLRFYYHRDEKNVTTAVITDKLKLIAILTNLIKNAIKCTTEGTIEFGFNIDSKEISFYVKDTGIGIEKEQQQAIFDRFVQADMSISRSFEGSGLGLSISKAYVEMLGGKIWVESERYVGSSFYFVLPIFGENLQDKTLKKVIKEDKRTEEVLKKLKVLVAEDDDVAQMYLTTLFKNKCKKIYYAANGKEAVELFRKHPDISLVLMDMKMPEMDGYMATSKIKEINKNTVIIAQTAYALSGDREKAISYGCDDYIPKPLNKKVLIKMIDKYFC